jgi:hypothetical protein
LFMEANGHQERPTTGVPTDGPPTDHVRLSVAEAARALGITEGAVRSRIKRGTLPTIKEDGNVFVLWGSGTSEANHPTYTDEPRDVPTGEPSDQPEQPQAGELVESLREQIDYLKGQLDVEREAGRRKDHLLAAALERIPQIEAPQEASETPPRRSEAKEGEERVQDDGERLSWWRRLFG